MDQDEGCLSDDRSEVNVLQHLSFVMLYSISINPRDWLSRSSLIFIELVLRVFSISDTREVPVFNQTTYGGKPFKTDISLKSKS